MRGARIACAVIAAAAIVAGCSSTKREISNRFGDCTFRPKTVCTQQDLSAIAASTTDLDGADLSGTNLTGADLRRVSLRDAKLVKTVLDKADLTGADLRNANLTGASMIGTVLSNADLDGAIQTGITFCNTVLPDGSVTNCKILTDVKQGKPDPPPQVLQARARRPVHCIVDGIGDGIEVDFRTRDAQSVVFSVDDVRASDSNFASGIQRIPFRCDGHPHTVSVEAFGRTTPPATRTFTVSVEEGTPEPFPR